MLSFGQTKTHNMRRLQMSDTQLEEFRELMKPVMETISGGPVDEDLESRLNADFPSTTSRRSTRTTRASCGLERVRAL